VPATVYVKKEEGGRRVITKAEGLKIWVYSLYAVTRLLQIFLKPFPISKFVIC
jgi:hypothetical protein